MKAVRLMQQRYGVGEVKVHLHKMIPLGAGLGGGSSDAAFTIKALDSLFGLGLTVEQLCSVAAELGSDTAFFIGNNAALCHGRGEITEPFDTGQLCGKHITIVKPPFGIPTIEAYAGIVPQKPETPLRKRLEQDISIWRGKVKNDFEPSIFAKYPVLAAIKEALYDAGAIYASMSGSGSAIFAISEERLVERLKNRFADTRNASWFDDSCILMRNENDIILSAT
jgi:4-diphosphocytidyl-2-C-methyl-D-erythritol kinase